MSPKRPINADVTPPAAETKPEAAARKSEPSPPAAAKSTGRTPKPLGPKLLAALVVLAVVIIVVAIVGGSGGHDEAATEGAPAPPASGSDGGNPAAAQTPEALGYPSFATNNTTRIGGADPAANAAAVALAVFPSTSPEQRPAAVAVVDEADLPDAIAAAELMAPPIRAPLLFSSDGGIPAASAEALAALDPSGSKETNGVSAFAIGRADQVQIPVEGTVERVVGANRTPFATAAAVAGIREKLAGPPQHIVIAPLGDPEFAAPAASWAARSGDPVLFVESNRLPPETAQVLRRRPKLPVYVLGPTAAVSKSVFSQLEKISKRVTRVAGKDPAANALALARFHDGSFGWNVNDPGHGFVLARSDAPADAAAAAPLSASGSWGPLLLTEDAGTLPDAVRNYLLDVKPGYTTDPTRAFYNRFWLIGDQSAISLDQQAEVNELAELAKIGGKP